MALSIRLLWALVSALFKAKIAQPHGPVTRSFRILPFVDCETGITLNAAKYFVLADIVQNECNLRSGFIGAGLRNGLWAVALGNAIYYRRPVKAFHKVHVTVELIGWDDRFFVWQNTFRNVKNQVCAVSFTKVAVRSKEGVVAVNDCFEMMGIEFYSRELRKDVGSLFGNLSDVAKSVFAD